MKIRPLGAQLFHVYLRRDRRKDRYEEANILFTQFSEIA
jgi:hypothetical protein